MNYWNGNPIHCLTASYFQNPIAGKLNCCPHLAEVRLGNLYTTVFTSCFQPTHDQQAVCCSKMKTTVLL